MFSKWSFIALCLAVLAGMLMGACAPGAGGGGVPSIYVEPGTGTPGAPGNPGYSDGTVVSSDNSVTSSDGSGSSTTGPGSVAPGAAAGDTSNPGAAGSDVTPSANLLSYSDSTYKFAVRYPSNYTFRPLTADQIAALTPTPQVGFAILSPSRASSQTAEPADLEIRVYLATGVTSLDSFLPTLTVPGGLLPTQPYQTDNGASGVKVCTRLMVAPNCSYVFLANGYIYQLTPSSIEGEAAAKSFQLNP